MTANAPEDYKVAFGKFAWILDCEDSAGRLIFTFEINPAEKSKVYLSKRASIEVNGRSMPFGEKDESERHRLDKTRNRVQRYLEPCGYQVS
jgi:hypothetical protein